MTDASLLQSTELDQAMEAWLQAAVQRGDIGVDAMAQAMRADGFPEASAQVLAALGMLRHADAPLHQVHSSANLRDATLSLMRYYRQARRDVCEERIANELAPLPPRVAGGQGTRRLADGRTISLRAAGTGPDFALLDGVLTPQECDGLIALARDQLNNSRVMSAEGDVVNEEARTSSDTFLAPGSSPLLNDIESRIAELIQWPVAYMEEISIVRYRPGEQFVAHWDYFETPGFEVHRAALEQAGQRVGTVVLYLSDVDSGGSTGFEFAGVDIWPCRGSALYFTYRLPDGTMDATSLHAGAAVEHGEKWIATLWLRERPYRN